MKRKISLTINGKPYSDEVEPRLLLIHYLREVAGLTGPHIGCETSICGACTVMLDGKAVKSCTMFAVQADGRQVLTIEGLAAERQARSRPGGLLERARAAVRLLHAGHDPHRQTAAGRPPEPHRSGDPPRARRQSLPLHRLSAHRQRREGRGGKGGCITMATTITKPETLVGKRIRRQEDPRLITGTATYVDDIKMPGMHHACIVRSPHAAATHQGHQHQGRARAARRRRRLHRRGYQGSRSGALRRLAARPARAASSPAGAGSRLLRRPSRGRGRRHRSLHRSRRGRPGRGGLRAAPGRRRSREGDRPRRARGPSRVARQRRVHLPPGRRRHRTGLPRCRRRRQAAHHQPAADSHRHGDARRGGRLARRREIADPVLVHADSAPAAHAGGGNPGHAGEPAARDHARSGRRLRLPSSTSTPKRRSWASSPCASTSP